MLGRGFDDPQVGLMRHQQVDLVGRDAGPGERLVAGVGHGEHGGLEHLAPRHLHVVGPLADDLLADRIGRAAARPVEQRREAPVGLDEGGEDPAAGVRRAAHHRGAGAVAEEDGGGAVLEVGDGGQLLGADDEHGLALTRGDEALRHGEARRCTPGTPRRCRTPRRARRRGAPAGRRPWTGAAGRGWRWRGRWRRGRPPSTPAAAIARSARLLAQHRDGLLRPWRCGARGCRCARRSTRRTCRARGSGRALVRTPGGTATPTLATSANGRAIMSAPRSRAARTRPRCAR